MKRVAVISTASGNGKTTVATALAARLDVPYYGTTVATALAVRLDVPYYELDALHHGPNWAEPTPEEFRATVEPIVESDAWVIDGAYRGKLGDLVLEGADVVVWLDLPLRVWLPRLLHRTARRIISREELWNGNRERLMDALHPQNSVVFFALRHFRDRRRRYPSELAGFPVVRLRTSGEVDDFVKSAKPQSAK